MDDQHEEVEHIPWGELLAPSDDARRRALYLIAGALAAVVLGVVISRAVSSPAQPAAAVPAEAVPVTTDPSPAAAPPPVTMPATSPATVVSTTTDPTTTTDPITTTTTVTVPIPVLYTEADLMAHPPDLAARAAVARAEWFVTDYFTADLEPNGTADVRGALPVGVELPEMPQDVAVGLSYVEWARAFRVEASADGTFLVGVAYRLLGAPPERGFQRLPVRAVEVRVAVSESGGSVVLDLPSPVPLPAGPSPQPWPSAGEVAPQPVVEGAMAAAAGWGWEHRVLGSWRVAGGWRVMLSAADELGNRWPLVVVVDDAGALLR